MRGKLIIFSAPSGAGKTTLVKYLLQQDYNLEFSVSATSRKPRPGEVNGKDYHFLSEKEFHQKIENNEFLEWEEVYSGVYYGTLKSEVERIRNRGKNVLFDVDVVGGMNIKKYYGAEALAVFVQPPSLSELRRRLENRSTEPEEKINMRIAKAEQELTMAGRFDVVIVNDDLNRANEEAGKTVSGFLYSLKNVGLYFGSFNPVHVGHMVIANYMVEFSGLDELWFIVSPQNPHKQKTRPLNDDDRLELLQLAVEGDERFRVSDIEFSLSKPSYTYNTLACLKDLHPEINFKILMGSDNLVNFHKWKNYESIVKNYEVIVYPRPGFDKSKAVGHKSIAITEGAPLMEISSSFIRKAIKKGMDMRHFLPGKVWERIVKRGFYR
jgi:guanylate kinase/nicotinate (nicotinamide) nucleotide adenylyltransferase